MCFLSLVVTLTPRVYTRTISIFKKKTKKQTQATDVGIELASIDYNIPAISTPVFMRAL